MKDIFSELYKKVLSFFNNEAKEENSKDTACNRLKLVLMQDRAKMEPALMEKMREEMIGVISKYVEIDKDALDLNIEAEGDSFALMLNIPVLRAKTREEIEEQEGIVIKDEDDDDEEEITEEEKDETDDKEDSLPASDENKDENEDEDEDTSVTEQKTEENKEIKTEDKVSSDDKSEKNIKANAETEGVKTEDTNLEETSSVETEAIKPAVIKKKIKQQPDEDL